MEIFRIEIDNKFEADVFTEMLKEENIPHTVINNFSLAYSGLFQMTMGWGHIEVPVEYKEKALELFENYKKSTLDTN